MSDPRHMLGLVDPEVTGLDVKPLVGRDCDAALAHVRRFVGEGARGWICYTGLVALVECVDDVGEAHGPPLSGELVLGRRTLTIRWANPREGYLVHELERTAGDAYWCVPFEYLGIEPGAHEPDHSRKVRYEVFWPRSLDLDGAGAQAGAPTARFAGFVEREAS